MRAFLPPLRNRTGPRLDAAGQPLTPATYSYQFEWQGRRITRRTEHRSKRGAIEQGNTHLAMLRAGLVQQANELLRRRAAPNEHTLGDVFRAASALYPTPKQQKTLSGYVSAWRCLLRTAGHTGPAEEFPLARITAELAAVFQAGTRQHADDTAETADTDDTDEADPMRPYRTANRYHSLAAALLSHANQTALTHPPHALTFPELKGFLDYPLFKGTEKTNWQLPDDALLQRTLTDLEAKRDTDRNLYIAVWLALGAGLRKSETARTRAGWLCLQGGRPAITLRMQTKNGDCSSRVTFTNGAWARLSPILPADPDAHLLTGSMTERTELVFDRVSEWMRALGWETQKTYHEFRAIGGCQVAMRDGLLAARDWCRHRSITTTERSYGRYIRTIIADAPIVLPGANIITIPTSPTTPATPEQMQTIGIGECGGECAVSAR